MKKFILIIVLTFITSAKINAQSYYQLVRETANKVVNNPKSSQEMIDINQFEVTALNYMVAEAAKRGIVHHPAFYDIQAVYMKSFVEDFLLYVVEARKISSAKRKQVVDCFKNASLKCPMFHDNNKLCLAFTKDENSLTPFSLDTDWDKAYEMVSNNIKSIISIK